MNRVSRRALIAAVAGLAPFGGLHQFARAQNGSTPIEPIDPTPVTGDPDEPVVVEQPIEADETPTDAGAITPTGRYFGDTGHNLKGPFLGGWETSGGRNGIGAAISEERFAEGIGVTQSFQAVSLVFDPGLEAPWDVQATHLPDTVRTELAPASARKAITRAPGNAARFFAETGHSLGGAFLSFWEEHGDLPIIGMPTTEPFTSVTTGLQTQVFERAVLERSRGGDVGFLPIAERLAAESGLLSDPAFLPAPPVGGTTKLVKSIDGLRLRARPSLTADIIVLLPDNAEFIAAAGESGDWYAGYADGYAGYVFAEYLAEAPPLPEISLSDWDTTRWQGAALGETNVRSSPDTGSEITRVLAYGDEVTISDWVEGEEVFIGADLWAKTTEGDYVYARNIGRNAPVAAPPMPANAPASGRWIDVNLTQQLMVAYEGRSVSRVIVTTTGMAGWETPPGSYQILWRVANETMDSDAIGAEHFYKLEDVLFTQYFTERGHAIHYAWWRTPQTIGRPGSHGCLNTLLEDAQFLWDWAAIGTPVIVHH